MGLCCTIGITTIIAAVLSLILKGKAQTIKWWIAYFYLRINRLYAKRRFGEFDPDSPDAYISGFLPHPKEKEFEFPKDEQHLCNASDEVFFYGTNSKKEHIVVRIARGINQEAEAWIYLKLSNGKAYSLPQGIVSRQSEDSETFTAGGLKISCLWTMRRWRIFFSGLLKETSGDFKENEKIVFVRFSFIWTVSSNIYDFVHDTHPALLATSLAEEKWNGFLPPMENILEVLNGYEQAGALMGTVTIEDQEEQEVCLWGTRYRYLGTAKLLTSGTFRNFYGHTENGSVVHIGEVSLAGVIKNLKFGMIVQSNSMVSSVESCSISPPLGVKSKNLNIWFKAGGYPYGLIVEPVGEESGFTSTQGWSGDLQMRFINIAINIHSGGGAYISGSVKKLESKSHLSSRKEVAKGKPPLVLWFTDPKCQIVEYTGGKGSSLAKLTEFSSAEKTLTVPAGMVVTTSAYQEFIKNISTSVLEEAAGSQDKTKHQSECEKMVERVGKADIPKSVCDAIETNLSKLFHGVDINKVKFAVRSSALGEDGDQMSCAGQMDTYLGIQGLNEILNAVKKCWASQFTFIATEYKRRYGQSLNSPMAVVIQEMVPCDVAGVMFTCDPLTGNPSVISITANFGLGESVVSATAEPDTITLKRNIIDNQLSIDSTSVGSKKIRIVIKESGGTLEEELKENESKSCCLSSEQALLIGRVGVLIADKYSSPRDIEWGLIGSHVYLLQSRPVTSIDTETDFEIMHEFDTFLRQEDEYTSKVNVGEVMPGATSPLGLSSIMKFFQSALQSGLWKFRESFSTRCPYFYKGISISHNHVLFNIVDGVFRFKDKNAKDNAKAWMIALFGRLLDDDRLFEIAEERNSLNPMSFIGSLLPPLFILKDAFLAKRSLDKTYEEYKSYRIPVEKFKTAQELFEHLVHNGCRDLDEPMHRHMENTTLSSLYNMYMLSVLAKIRGDWNTETFSDFAYVLATCTKVESADVPTSIQSLAYAISKNIDPAKFKAMTEDQALEWLKTTNSVAGTKYKEFITKHAHRCLKEFDVNSKPWGIDPKPLIQMLQNFVTSVTDDAKEKEDVTTDEVLSKLQLPFTFKTRLLMKLLLPLSRRSVRLRERSKSLYIRSINAWRQAFQHMAKLMVQEGRLPEEKLLCFMTLEEIQELFKSRSPKIISKAVKRLRLYPEMDSLRFPEIMVGFPKPINMNATVEHGSGFEMKGIPVSQGIARGPARVVNCLEEAVNIQSGDILIAYSTDIGWSPYFPLLAGVVTELGGLISHGAVVAREYGLPCVVGLHGATLAFQSGDTVILDGNKGLLKKVESND